MDDHEKQGSKLSAQNVIDNFVSGGPSAEDEAMGANLRWLKMEKIEFAFKRGTEDYGRGIRDNYESERVYDQADAAMMGGSGQMGVMIWRGSHHMSRHDTFYFEIGTMSVGEFKKCFEPRLVSLNSTVHRAHLALYTQRLRHIGVSDAVRDAAALSCFRDDGLESKDVKQILARLKLPI
ncbi:hypothetical protein FGU71_03190 [Erythrobacter insulae]|uniref:Uncharacterized protein n=1 Tax=Erythrobacter insulae TaxID=2584124 RepID=A0A547P9Y1_9SPHN|nr:hypothetical protein [Erythrobacter insulae]TRD10961.1 hypothetical protein FGU71_03190 [Erythrobacter insulae]